MTAKLAELVKDGELEIMADNNIAGDPADNVVKQLRVKYVLDGGPSRLRSRENQTLRLPLEETSGRSAAPRLVD